MSIASLALRPRDPGEAHRAASPLELFTDLCYVVAIAQGAAQTHHAVSHGDTVHGLVFFAISFFAIWWAWLNFAWFNSAYDNDDVVNRVLTLLQIVGSLVLAAGIPRMFEEDFVLAVLGYSIMRVGLVLMWVRAAIGHAEGRRTAVRYAIGLLIVQGLWLAFLLVGHDALIPVFVLFALADVLVPLIAERTGSTPWHPHHIAERYGLLFIIVLGETVLSATVAIQVGLDGEQSSARLLTVVAGGLLLVFSAWWLYFAREAAEALTGNNVAYLWGFGHLVIFGSVALVGAALAVRVDYYSHEAHVSDRVSSLMLTVPVVLFLLALWLLIVRLIDASARTWGPFAGAVVLVLASTWTPAPELFAGIVCAALLVVELRLTRGAGSSGRPTAIAGGGH